MKYYIGFMYKIEAFNNNNNNNDNNNTTNNNNLSQRPENPGLMSNGG